MPKEASQMLSLLKGYLLLYLNSTLSWNQQVESAYNKPQMPPLLFFHLKLAKVHAVMTKIICLALNLMADDTQVF